METTKQQQKENTSERYYEGVGRRKSAVARVRLFVVSQQGEEKSSSEEGEEKVVAMTVNDRPYQEHFCTQEFWKESIAPLVATGMEERFRISVKVSGGGMRGQAGAVKLGIARALLAFDEGLRPTLRAGGYLTRDARRVERKKPGLKKARRAPQWSKR